MNEQSPPTARLIRFGVFELDPKAGELRKSGMKTRLPEQSLQLLMMLLQQPGQVVTREEMRKRLWPNGTFVDFDHSLNAAMKRLREALDDSADNARFVETLPRHGYRFIYPVAAASPPPTVVGADGGAPAVAPVGARPDLIGDRRAEDAAHRAALQKWTALVVGIVVVALAALFALNVAGLRDRLLTAVGARHGVPVPKIESIAVLPLENLSGDKEQEYFADGMTEELITNLGKVSALRVISRTSVMQYKKTKKPLPEIARELNVDAVVEGSVLHSGERVRITAQLIQISPEKHLWAEAYERDVRDILALQGEVARAITREVQLKLTPQEAARLTAVRAVNPQAHEAYLRGLYNDDWEAGNKLLLQAAQLDPHFGQPYMGLASHYYFFALWGFQAPREGYPKVEEFVRKGLSIDDTLADAHGYMALVRLEHDWNWAEAEREFKRALELNPNNADNRHNYAHFLLHMGRVEESRAESERAVQINPFDTMLRACLGWHCLYTHQLEEAIEHCNRVLQIEPDAYWAHMVLGWVYEEKKMLKEAIAEFKKAPKGFTDTVLSTAALAHAQAVSGDVSAARKTLAKLIRRSKRGYVSAYDIAVIYAGLGEKDRVFEWLEKAYEERSSFLVYIKGDPRFEAFRADERFQNLIRRIGLPP